MCIGSNRVKWWFAFLALALTGVAVPALLAQDQRSSQQTHHAVILNEETSYEIKDVDEAELTFSRRVEISDREGNDYGRVYLMESSFSDIKDFAGRIYNNSGELIYEADKGEGEKYCGFSGYALYQDVCAYKFALTSSSFPYTAEYEYRIKYNSLFFWPDWEPEAAVPVLSSTYSLSVPEDFGLNTLEEGEIGTSQVSNDGDREIYTWHLDSLDVVEDEPCAPEYARLCRRLRFAPVEFKLDKYDFQGGSWHQLSSDFEQMVKKQFDLSKDQKKVIERWVSHPLCQREICDRLHDYLQSRSRYVAIEIGIGGWLPSKAKETYERGYGDCKDLSTMYVAMLRQAGIEARTALILTKGSGANNPDFPTLNDFNHVIMFAVIDGDTIWTDPTCDYCQFGDLPSSVEDTYALVVDPAVGDLVKTPVSQPQDNLITRVAQCEPKDDRSLSIALLMTAEGNPGQRLQWSLDNLLKHELESMLKSDLFGLSGKFAIDSVVSLTAQDSRHGASAMVYGGVRNAIHSVGSKQYVDLTFLSPFCRSELIDFGDRTQGVDLRYPRIYADTLIVTIPPGCAPVQSQPDTSLVDSFGSLTVSLNGTEKEVVLARTRSINCYLVEPNELLQFEVSVERQREAIPSLVVFVKE